MTAPILRPGAVALVVGASSGIGAATAAALADKGARVVCASRNEQRLHALAERIGAETSVLGLDVADPPSTRGLLERLPERLREIDILVNCAGHDVGGRQRFDLGGVEDWASIVETNVTGMIRVCHAVIPGMLARGRGHVVNLGSVVGLKTYAGGSIYSATKFAVRAFTEALRADYKDSDLRITEILPGLTRTGFAEARHRGDVERAQAFYDRAPGILEPEDVARCVIFALEQPPHVDIAQILVVPTRET